MAKRPSVSKAKDKAKRRASSKRASTGSAVRAGGDPLAELRGKIDAVDAQIQRLIAQLQKSLFMLCKTLRG